MRLLKKQLKPLADALIDHDCNTDAVNRWAEGWQSKNGEQKKQKKRFLFFLFFFSRPSLSFLSFSLFLFAQSAHPPHFFKKKHARNRTGDNNKNNNKKHNNKKNETTSLGPRIWDSKGLAAIAAAVFPGTQAYAVELILRELQNQVNGLEAVLDAALASAQAEGQKQGMRLLDVLPKLLEKAFRGENIPPPFEAPRIDVKLGFFRVNCNNKSKIQGVNAEAPAEGYVYWVFAWRMKGGVVSA